MNRPQSWLPVFFVSLTVLVFAAFFGWRYHQASKVDASTEPPLAAAPQAPPAAAETPPTDTNAPPPGKAHPVEDIETADEEASAPEALPALDESDATVSARMAELIGREQVLGLLQADGLVRRVVATVDNLPRQRAPAAAWPVNPTPQRFTTQAGADGTTTIHPDNSQRYTPLVRVVEAVDTAKAVAVYRTLYPLFQQAYEELGFPGRYFNDRVVQVLDHLIATPVQNGPLAVTLLEVKGEMPSTRPWVRYEFADPALESLSAGRKMLIRTGPENHRRLQAKLVDIRQRIAKN
jgi:hypothetical protein